MSTAARTALLGAFTAGRRHGRIAERVAAALTAAGLPAQARPVQDIGDVEAP